MENMYRLIDYFDVWGNEKDGYQVNDLATIEYDIYISNDATQRDILNLLKGIGYFKKHVRLNMIDFSIWDDGFIEIEQKRTGKPICRFERQRS